MRGLLGTCGMVAAGISCQHLHHLCSARSLCRIRVQASLLQLGHLQRALPGGIQGSQPAPDGGLACEHLEEEDAI